ncbi:MAG: hypothetical protein PHT33_02505 [bacterium]|nr:hypothetical protein [bacterium]
MVYGSSLLPCPNSDFHFLLKNLISEIVGSYDVDGLFMDGPVFLPSSCFCLACRDRALEKTGEALVSLSPLERLRFKYASLEDRVALAVETSRRIREIPVYCNGRGISGHPSYSCGSPARMQTACNVVMAEAFPYFPSRSPNRPLWAVSGTARQLQAVAAGRPVVVAATITTRPGIHNVMPASTLKSLTAQAAANGASIWYECSVEVLRQGGSAVAALSR